MARMERTVPAGTFKARCLALLDHVAETGEPIVVTKRGRPVARVVPMEERTFRSTMGSVTLISKNEEDYFSTGESWDVEGRPTS